MAVGRIKKSLKEYINYKKYKKFNVPIKDKNNNWNLLTEDFINKDYFIYSGNILNVMGEYCNDSLVYYFNYSNLNISSHEHSFDYILFNLYEYPETFNIKDEDKKYYTERQLHFLNSLQKKLIEDGLKDISILYEEHKMKKNYEKYYHEYNNTELKKRNIK